MSCLRPYTKKDGTVFPCGKCPSCVNRVASGWAFRLMQEERNSSSSLFITFTYDDTNLQRTESGKRTLYKRDLQLFFKRLRKRNPDSKIKYYAVGEYGSKTKRPHYHAIIFNANVDTIELAWSERDPKTKQQVIIGELYYGDVSGASIGYTLKYISKGRSVPEYYGDDRQPEFSLMSKGLGKCYLTKNMINWHKADFWNRRYLNMPGGHKVAMPRYYYEKLYDGYERDLLKMSGSLINQDEFFKQFESGYHNSPKFLKDHQIYKQRVDAAFRKHKIKNLQSLKL